MEQFNPLEPYVVKFINEVIEPYKSIYLGCNNVFDGHISEFTIKITSTINITSFIIKDKAGDYLTLVIDQQGLKIPESTMSINRIKYTIRYLTENWMPLQTMLDK